MGKRVYVKAAEKLDVRQYAPGTVVQVAIDSESVASAKTIVLEKPYLGGAVSLQCGVCPW